jgi:hypothetical protein
MGNAWQFWSAEQISSILGAPLANISANWPYVYAALNARGMADLPVLIAALATIGVEASVFAPIEEYRNADGSIPRYWYGYSGGPEFHGRGFVQITHDYNYAAAGQALGVDLVGNPDLALDPKIAAEILSWYFDTHGGGPLIPEAARAGDWPSVRELVNGGLTGYATFLSYVQAFLDA